MRTPIRRGFIVFTFKTGSGETGGYLYVINPVQQLEMRAEFLSSILNVVGLCNWELSKIEDLQKFLLEELCYIDNLMYEIYERTENQELAFSVWEAHMEDLRRWLSLILGIKIKYV